MVDRLQITLSLAVFVVAASPLSAFVVADRADRGPPPDGPDHGINVTTFYRLWSGDVEDPNATPPANATPIETVRALANATDATFDRPPAAVGEWNAGDHADFDPGGIDRSVHPAGANLTDVGPVRDAYVRVFSVGPSTVVHRANRTVTYVASSGTVRAVMDYRVAVPADNTTGPRRVNYSVERSTVSVELLVNGTPVDRADDRTPVLEYDDLSGRPTLTVAAGIGVTVTAEVRTCEEWNDTVGVCDGDWTRSVDESEVTLRVTDERTVRAYDPEVSATRARYPRRPDGAAVHAPAPWLRMEFGDEAVTGGWQFYTAGSRGWTTMVSSTGDGNRTRPSSVRPLRTHAVPTGSEPAVRRTNRSDYDLELAGTWSAERPGPTLPDVIDVRTPESYEHVRGLVVDPASPDDAAVSGPVRMVGLVRGVNRTVDLDRATTVRPTTVDLSTHPLSNGTYAVNLTVRDGEGRPVTNGYAVVEGRRVSLSAGHANVTVDTPGGLVRVRYEPKPWWNASPAYQPARASAMPAPVLPDLQFLIDLAVVTILWFLPVVALLLGVDMAMNTDFVRGILDDFGGDRL